jgi:hypothetical protein
MFLGSRLVSADLTVHDPRLTLTRPMRSLRQDLVWAEVGTAEVAGSSPVVPAIHSKRSGFLEEIL